MLHELVRTADVFIQNWRPGVADRLGVGYEKLCELNPALVYLSISGFGQTGPYSKQKVYDSLIQAQVGLATINGHGNGMGEPRPPTLVPNVIMDKVETATDVYPRRSPRMYPPALASAHRGAQRAMYPRVAARATGQVTANTGVQAVLAALWRRDGRGGKSGQHIELSMMDAGPISSPYIN